MKRFNLQFHVNKVKFIQSASFAKSWSNEFMDPVLTERSPYRLTFSHPVHRKSKHAHFIPKNGGYLRSVSPCKDENVEKPSDLTRFVGSAAQEIVPPAPPPTNEQVERIYDFIANSKQLVVLTGAGVSTESGIPDYRSPKGAYNTGFKPMSHQEFLSQSLSRQRYWARSYLGWRRFIGAQPSASHRALARLEANGRLAGGVVTQNVDRLHHAAGSSALELHGTTHETVCLSCGRLAERKVFQERMRAANPQWAAAVEDLEIGTVGSDARFGMNQRPDGDIEIDEKFWRDGNLTIPECLECGGTLKPNVVFFGDNVPKARVERANQMVTGGDALLVVGSSLAVWSAYRLVKAASDMGNKIAILTVGPTRGDDLTTLKVEARSGEVLNRVLATGSMDVPNIL